MERAQVRVLEELNDVHLGSLLKREEGRRLKPHVPFHVLRNLECGNNEFGHVVCEIGVDDIKTKNKTFVC